MAALKAFAAQILGGVAAMLVLSGTSGNGSPYLFAFVQGSLAAAAARLLGAAPWWLLIHLLFAPAVVTASHLGLPPWIYFAGFVTLLAVFWNAYRGEAPLFLSSRGTMEGLLRLLPAGTGIRIAELGAGTGRVAAALAAARPDIRVEAFENAPLPYLLARLACARYPHCSVSRTDFWKRSLADFDCVYAFLSPAVMERLWAKARREMKPGALLVSNAFPVPGVAPEAVVEAADRRGSHLYCYRIGSAGGQKAELGEKSAPFPSIAGAAHRP